MESIASFDKVKKFKDLIKKERGKVRLYSQEVDKLIDSEIMVLGEKNFDITLQRIRERELYPVYLKSHNLLIQADRLSHTQIVGMLHELGITNYQVNSQDLLSTNFVDRFLRNNCGWYISTVGYNASQALQISDTYKPTNIEKDLFMSLGINKY